MKIGNTTDKDWLSGGNSNSQISSSLNSLRHPFALGAEMLFDEAVLSPPELRAFLQAMPKGAELHYHLTGGAYAENLIRSGANRGACIDVNKADAPARRFWSPRFPLRHESFVALLRLGRNQHLAVAQRLDVVSVGCPRRLPFCCGCPA